MKRSRIWFIAPIVAPLLAGCTTDAYCYGDCGQAVGAAGEGGAGGQHAGGAGGSGGMFIPNGGSGGNNDCQADLMNDLQNCGACGNVCVLPGATAKCDEGKCLIEQCASGFYDVNGDPSDGCEYACAVPVPGPEVCDGMDNDCDGKTDSEDPDLTPPPQLCNTTPGTPCEQATAVCNGETGWSCNYPPEVEVDSGFVRSIETKCDGFDGNCDGQVDETFTTLGTPCDDGGVGACREYGAIACDPNDDSRTFCDLSLPPDARPPSQEICNNIDDDCNGVVDDGVIYDMVAIPDDTSPVVYVDRYEASRADATATSAGLASFIACANPGVVPWTAIAWDAAKAACEARGPKYRLCTAEELRLACQGASGNLYPYGASYMPNTCNGYDYDGVPGGSLDHVLVPTGSAPECVTPTGLFDLSGNATEWTSTKTGETNTDPVRSIYQLHGGSYLSPEAGLQCDIALAPRAGQNTILDNVGFRCCADP